MRIVKTAPKAFIKDSEDCTILNGFPAGSYTCADFGGWYSDYDGMFTLDCTEVITDNGDGTSNNTAAYYKTEDQRPAKGAPAPFCFVS